MIKHLNLIAQKEALNICVQLLLKFKLFAHHCKLAQGVNLITHNKLFALPIDQSLAYSFVRLFRP